MHSKYRFCNDYIEMKIKCPVSTKNIGVMKDCNVQNLLKKWFEILQSTTKSTNNIFTPSIEP